MKEEKWLRSHVERCLQDMWDEFRLDISEDGSYPFRSETAACWVKIDPLGEPATVHVTALAAVEVPRSGKLLREINELNQASRFTTIFWWDGAVMVKQAILAATLDADALGEVCDSVVSVADEIGVLIASVYGGGTPFVESRESSEDESADGEVA